MKPILRTCSACIAVAALLQPPLAFAQMAPGPIINPQPDPTGDVAKVFVAPASDPELPEAQMTALLRAHVKYVFVLFQENRSFDSYFGSFRGANGLFSDGAKPRAAGDTLGFTQPILSTDGTTGEVQPFRIGPDQHAADTDDVDHGHVRMAEKMDLVGLNAKMDRFALIEEKKYTPAAPTIRRSSPSRWANSRWPMRIATRFPSCGTTPTASCSSTPSSRRPSVRRPRTRSP